MGLAANGSYLYIASEYTYTCDRIEYCVEDSAETYIPFQGISDELFDIAYQDGDIWLALDDSEQPVKRFDGTGSVVDYLASDIVPHAHGLTIDGEGRLWVGDMENDVIYCVDPQSALQRRTWAGIKLFP